MNETNRADMLAEVIEEYVKEWSEKDSWHDFRMLEDCYKFLCTVTNRDSKDLKEISDI